MQKKGVCHQIQAEQAHSEGLLREIMRNGGYQCHAFLHVGYLRKQGSTCGANKTVLIKFIRQLWLSIVVF